MTTPDNRSTTTNQTRPVTTGHHSLEPISPLGLQNNYHRPNAKWDCGNLQFGCPCATGPSVHGKCLGTEDCHPLREGDRWVCTRPAFRGGACEKGPDENGQCCSQRPACTPRRSLRFRRRMFCWGVATSTLGLLLILLATRPVQEVIVPGPLSSAHAELLMHKGANRCAECHPGAHQSAGQWIARLAGMAQPPAESQTELCLECHQQSMDRTLATFAHNLPPEQLQQKTRLASHNPEVNVSLTDMLLKSEFQPQRQLACSTCHREHHGMKVDMTAMTNQQCQSCHVSSIGHFETTHPEFALQAGGETKTIHFDHRTHGLKHFAQAKESFDCARCHKGDSTGNVQRLTDYQTACASCHQSAIHLASQQSLKFMSFPLIDPVALQEAGTDLGQWPEALCSDFDGELNATTRLLLQADPKARQALYILGDLQNWIDLDVSQEKQLQAAAEVLLGMKRLLIDLSVRGPESIRQRIQIALQQEISTVQLEGLLSQVSTDTFRAARQRWFPDSLQDVVLEDCFPVYQSANPAAENVDQPQTGSLVASQGLYGRLATPEMRRALQDLLAENPLSVMAGTAESSTSSEPASAPATAPQAAAAHAGHSSPVPPAAPVSQSPVSQTPASQLPPASGGELLAPNPLSGLGLAQSQQVSSDSALSAAKPVNPQNGTPQNAGGRVSQSGDLLAPNPLAQQHDSSAAVTQQNSQRPADQTQEDLAVGSSVVPSQIANSGQASTEGQTFSAEDEELWRERIEQALRLSGQESLADTRGWKRDDETFTISYTVSGHADPWLSSWIRLAADQRVQPSAGQVAAIQLYNQLSASPAAQSCLQCHNGDQTLPTTPLTHPDNLTAENTGAPIRGKLPVQLVSTGDGRSNAPTVLAPFRQASAIVTTSSVTRFQWTALYRDPTIRGFTDFNHHPHTLQSGVTNCKTCHQLQETLLPGEAAATMATTVPNDFHPMTREQCASCHRSGGTSDGCTTCHNYHVGSRKQR